MCCAPVGADDLTDAPNFGTKFGRRRPCPRYGVPRGPVDQPGVQAKACGFPPPFSFCGGKKKTAVEPSKEKTPVAAQLRARDAPCRTAGRGPKRSCSVKVMSAGARAGPCRDLRTLCAVLHFEDIGQNLNLTSYYPRAFRFAKRCPGSRGAVPATTRRGR